jgi:hypothetical protein
MELSMTMSPQSLVWVAIVPLIAWRVYSRIRRLVGRQRSSPVRQWLAIVLLGVLIVGLSAASLDHADALGCLLGGVAAGVGLGVVGHRLTKFEQTAEGLFYTPNAHLGIALSMLLIGRIAYRMFTVAMAGPAAAGQALSPLTLLIFGTLAGYYVSYAIGLVLWRRRLAQAAPQVAAEQ